ncbi:MAG: hypothetical protein J0M15_16865 [Deltaproteobacteria bacterium]|nr:hypothetical protein [Deltaproteobacteria bacterium]
MKRLTKIIPFIKYSGLTLIVVVSPVFLFQNCSQFADPNDGSSSARLLSVAEPDPNHVVDTELAPPSKQIRIGNRRYMISIFTDIFTAENGTKAPQLDSLTFNWAEKRGAQLGGGCDVNDSLSLIDCGNDSNGANLPIHGDPNAVRESFKIQLCEELLGTTDGLKIALEKANLDINTLPDATSLNIRPIYELFYRTNEVPPYFTQTLLQLQTDLKAKNETAKDIWRGLLLVTCESPEWQLL